MITFTKAPATVYEDESLGAYGPARATIQGTPLQKRHDRTCQRLCFHYGVHAVAMPNPDQGWEQAVRRWLVTHGIEKASFPLPRAQAGATPVVTNRLAIIHLE